MAEASMEGMAVDRCRKCFGIELSQVKQSGLKDK